jgi:hypothetical protein
MEDMVEGREAGEVAEARDAEALARQDQGAATFSEVISPQGESTVSEVLEEGER